MLYRNWFNFFVPLFWEASFLAGISSIIVYHKYLLQGDISQSDPCIYTLKCAIVKAEGEGGEESGILMFYGCLAIIALQIATDMVENYE